MKTRTGMRLALPLIALCLGLSACSATPASDPSAPSGASEGGPTADQYQAWHLEFAACMREAGIDYNDPKPGDVIYLDTEVAGASEAFDACLNTLGNPPSTGQIDKSELVAELMERAECLRDQGYDVPDPEADGYWDLPEELYDAARACATD